MINVELGKKVELLRTSRGLSVLELAKLSNLNQKQIIDIEKGELYLTLLDLYNISKALKVKLKELF